MSSRLTESASFLLSASVNGSASYSVGLDGEREEEEERVGERGREGERERGGEGGRVHVYPCL